MPDSDVGLYAALTAGATAIVGAALLWAALNLLRSRRPSLALGRPLATAFGVRIVAAMSFSSLPIGAGLRGGDEDTFLGRAQVLADEPFGSAGWAETLTNDLYEWVFAFQYAALDSSDIALRFTQVTITVAALLLVATAVHDLAGARAGTLAGWLLAFEPASIFFSNLLHKEALMALAAALVVYGGAQVWTRAAFSGLAPMAAGCLIGLATRQYAGMFLIAVAMLVLLDAALRVRTSSGVQRLGFLLAVTLVAAVTVPAMLYATSETQLEKLQASQDANAANDEANLSLERVDFSTRSAIVTNLPKRLRDVVLRPYIWEIGSARQRLGVIGGLVTLALLVLLIQNAWRNRGRIMERAGPLVYGAAIVLIGYSIAAGNAGTAFRYRTHAVMLGIALVVVLGAYARNEGEQEVAAANSRKREPSAVPSVA